jgi:ribosome modulation factor
MSKHPLIECYEQGQKAFLDGKSDKANRYNFMSEQWMSWLRGYNTARHGKMLSDNNSQ